MTKQQALKERDRLRGEANRATAAADGHRDTLALLDRKLANLEQERKAALREQARTGSTADVEAFDRRQDKLARDRERAERAADAARDAGKHAEREFEELHRREFAALAEHAEELTREALGRLDQLEALYRPAYDAWRAARDEWNELGRRNGLSPVPFPALAGPHAVFAGPAPRPAEVEPADHPEHATDVDEPAVDEPDPGGTRVWEHADGRTQGAQIGGEFDQVLTANPQWQPLDPQQAA